MLKECVAVSSSMEDNARLLADLKAEVEYLERYKIHLLDRQQGGSAEEGGERQGEGKETRRAGKVDWEEAGRLVGEGARKTEEGLAFERRFGVFLCLEQKQPRRIAIYGSYDNQRLALAELEARLRVRGPVQGQERRPGRVSVEVDERSYTLLRGAPAKTIEKEMQEVCGVGAASSST